MPVRVNQPVVERAKHLRPFRLINGHHIQGDPHDEQRPGEDDDAYKARVQTHYFPGDVVESYRDLAGMWPEKFSSVDSAPQGPNPFLYAPAPGETQEEFERRMARLKAQGEEERTRATEGRQPPGAATQNQQPNQAQPNPAAEAAKAGFDPAKGNNPNAGIQKHTRGAQKPLEQMSDKELVDLAEAEEVPLKAGARRTDVLKALKDAGHR